MTVNELIADKQTFSSLSEKCNTIFDTGKRLPEFVFRHAFEAYFAIEYAYVYREEFGRFLSKLSVLCNDESINYVLLDPRPGDDYFSKTSFFGGVSFSPSSSVLERYLPVMSRGEGSPRILASANVGVFCGSSLRWGIHCDRISWELAVIAVPENVDVPAVSGIRCMDATALETYVQSQYHWKHSTASDFSRRFLANYAIRK